MQRFKNILYVMVPDGDNQHALKRAVTLAESNQARLTVVEVIDEMPPNEKLLDDLQEKIIVEQHRRLNEVVSTINKNIEVQKKVLIGISFLEITREVLRDGHDLVIKMAESGGLLDRVFGSDDMHLLRKCPCPVWLVKSKSPETYKRILASVDVDDDYPGEELTTRHQLNLQILEMASSLAVSEFSELHVVHAWEAIGESAMRSAIMKRPEGEIGAYVEGVKQEHKKNLKLLMDEVMSSLGSSVSDYIKPKSHLLKGSPRQEVPLFANEIKADLVVMGTVARTGISGFFMGNTAENILNRLNCSVLAIKPPGFKTPVRLDK